MTNDYQTAGTFAVAIVLALSFVGIARLLQREKLLYALGLILSALVYPPLAFMAGHREMLWLEVGGLFVLSPIALLGFKLNSRWLVFGWGGHAIWDVLFSSGPWWYNYGCVAFDLFLAGYIFGHFPARERPIDVAGTGS